MGRFWCNTCGNFKCTCKRDVERPIPEAATLIPPSEDRQRTFLVTNEETGVSEVLSEAEIEQNRRFNELIGATPLAWVTIALVAINFVVFLCMAFTGVSPFQPTSDNLLAWGADYGALTTQGQWWRLLTSMFVHAGVLHLAFNMFCLFRVGQFAERAFGNARFAALYLLAGLGGNLASLYWHPLLVCVGASGAIFGVYGAVLGLLISRPNAIPLARAQSLTKDAVMFIGVNLVYGITRPEVDVSAHIGGLVSGVLMGAALARPFLLPDGSLRSRSGVGSAAVVAGSAALLAMVAIGIPVTDDYRAEIKRLGSVEHASLALFNDSLTKLKKKDVNPGEFARIIENQVLPPWNAERERILKLRIPAKESSITGTIEKLGRYMALRAEAWGLIEKGVLANDVAMVRAANQKQAEAQSVVREIGSKNGPIATIPGKGITPCPNDPDYKGGPWDPVRCFDRLKGPGR